MLISTFLNDLYETTLKLGRSKFWLAFLGLIFLTVIIINGIGIVPEEPYQRLSENPFITRTDIHFNNYWQENPLLPIIAFYLRLSSPKTFTWLGIVLIAGAFLLFTLLSSQRWGSAPTMIFSTLLITSPVTTVLLSWLGTPDGLTVLLTVPFLFTQSSLLIFFLSILGITNHPAFLIVVIEILVLRWAARDNINFKHILISAFGCAVGYGLVRYFIEANGIEIFSRTDFMLLKSSGEWLKMNALNFPMSISSLFNAQWLIIPVCLILFYRRDKRFYALLLLILLTNYGMTFFTLDTTRIFSLVSWGILMECIFYSYRFAQSMKDEDPSYKIQFLQALIVIALISLITPRYYSWLGEIHTTPFYEFLRIIFR